MKVIITVRMIGFVLMLYLTSAGGEQVNRNQLTETAIFAGGCFWCMQPPFDSQNGVLKTIAGYTGGDIKNPNYEMVSDGATGHYEAVKIIYDSNKVSYPELLEIFWKNIDPTNGEGQFCDAGDQYRSAIFYTNDEQKRLAEKSKTEIEKNHFSSNPIETKIIKASKFFPAEEYHQSYYLKNPLTYNIYRFFCGRDNRLEELWGIN